MNSIAHNTKELQTQRYGVPNITKKDELLWESIYLSF